VLKTQFTFVKHLLLTSNAALCHLLLCCCQVCVEAGCRVQQVADELKRYGLSLQNYASIREQQIGGFTQVNATHNPPP
jgi:hypothetical protein